MTDPIDTARQEGIALGLAMAAAQCDAIAKDADDEDCLQFDRLIAPHMRGVALDIRALAPIPPHVAAARVLLDDLAKINVSQMAIDWKAIWGVLSEGEPVIRGAGWPVVLIGALEQIAKEGE